MSSEEKEKLEVVMIDGIDGDALSSYNFNDIFLHFQRTQKEFIKQRPGRGNSGSICRSCGGRGIVDGIKCKTCDGKCRAIDYVESWYVKQILNLGTKFRWSSYVDKYEIIGDEIIVSARVVIDINGKLYSQSAFGGSTIKYFRNTQPKTAISIVDDMNAALSKAVKKCASNWGIASDVYGRRTEGEE